MRTLLAVPLALTMASASASAAELSARDIAAKAFERGVANLVNLEAEVTLTSVDKAGGQKVRKLSLASKQIGGKLHTVVRFRAPADVAGIALLAVEGAEGKPDELTLYLPAYKRTRRIAASQRGAAFADTDFSYADFSRSGRGVQGEAKRLPDEKLLGRDAFVVEGPADPESPYSKVKAWIDQKTFVPLKTESFDKDGALLKTYTVNKLEERAGRTLATDATMQNAKTGTKTSLVLDKLVPEPPADSAFTERALERG